MRSRDTDDSSRLTRGREVFNAGSFPGIGGGVVIGDSVRRDHALPLSRALSQKIFFRKGWSVDARESGIGGALNGEDRWVAWIAFYAGETYDGGREG